MARSRRDFARSPDIIRASRSDRLGGELPPTRAGRRPDRTRLVFETATADADTIREAIAWVRASAGVDDGVDDGALLAMMVKRRIHDARAEDLAEGRAPPSTEPYRIVVEHCPECGSAHGGDCELTDTIGLEAACDAEVVEMRPGAGGERLPRHQGACSEAHFDHPSRERLLSEEQSRLPRSPEAQERGSLARTVPPKVRRAVLIRDGHRCRVPGCRNRNWVHVHHVKSRVFGGKPVEDNLVVLCDAHHRGLHAGYLGIEVVSGELVFRLRDGTVHTSPLDPRGSSA